MVANAVREMILLSINGLQARDKTIVEKLYERDKTVDSIYRTFLRDPKPHIHEKEKYDKTVKASISSSNPKGYISALLISRYLERISDHACYIVDSVLYIVTGDLFRDAKSRFRR
jgi:phosphate transport system protein